LGHGGRQILIERPNDSVVDLLADINPDRFERKFLAPRVRELRNDIEKIDTSEHPAAAFTLFYITFAFDEEFITSWTFGDGSYRCKWITLLRFIERDPSFKVQGVDMEAFNWAGHFSKLNVELKDDGAAHELMEVSDRALSGTPMVDYLQAIKLTAIAMDDRLQATAATQRRLVTSVLLKK
jgi:hypothetical protein